MNFFLRYPGGLSKALTLSYDDGPKEDIRMVSILKEYGLKCTFNLISERMGAKHGHVEQSDIRELYLANGMEVAGHTMSHPFLEQMPDATAVAEILIDRQNLERMTGQICKGFAYPYGTTSDAVVEKLRCCGIAYARTTVSTMSFGLPKNWLLLNPTCHHNCDKLMQLADEFLALRTDRQPHLFYLWGHTYEFNRNQNWNVIEAFAEKMGGRDDVWYATNIEIYDYVKDFNRLESSADGHILHNPTERTLWIQGDYTGEIHSGETLKI